MKILFLIIIIVVALFSCGKKGEPEYKSFYYKNKTVKII
jgi:hypothetical protein